jgi:fatty-acyl-CoA synthase
MLGAVLQTVNIRLSPEQIRYTIDHAGASVVLANVDFVPCSRTSAPSCPA